MSAGIDGSGLAGTPGSTLWALIRVFVPLSLVSIGGGPSIMAEMEHQVVTVHGWLSERDFIDLFAISRAAPGPGTLIVTLIGWKVAGWLGALVASLALYLPSSLLIYGAALLWHRYRGAQWRGPIERGLAPVAVGLIFAGAWSVLEATEGGWLAFATALASAALLLWRPVPPLLLIGGAAAFYGVWAAV